MIKRGFILLALAAIVALPFLLRPKHRAPERADDTLVVITPHNGAIREEFGLGFRRWYKARTGRSVALDWRVIGGSSDIARFLEGAYAASFRNYWTNTLHRPWSADVRGAFANPDLADNASPVEREARQIFLDSEVSCGLDVFYGGGSYDFIAQANAGRIVTTRVVREHQEWFRDETIPRIFAGEEYWDERGRWVGNVLSNYGILYNKDALRRLGIERPPLEWSDLADPRYVGEIGLADPTKSSSMATAFENVVQQQMQRKLAQLRAGGEATSDKKALEAKAVREGWLAGLRLLQRIGANARYFTDASQKPPIDVAQGDCAAGICIDFYGRSQAEVTKERGGGDDRLGFATPRGGTVSSVDPIAILRGAPHREVAEAFIEYTLTMDGQKLWNFRPGVSGGPVQFALRRLPVRRDFYAHEEWKTLRSDPDANPFVDSERLIYRPEWTGGMFRELSFVIRVMTLDTHEDLVSAWRAINAAPEPAKARALASLEDLSAVTYEHASTDIKAALNSKSRVDEITLARNLAAIFRENYARAEALAKRG